MSPPRVLLRAGLLSGVACLSMIAGTTRLLCQTEVHEQFWPEANVYVRTSYNTRIFLLTSTTRDLLVGPLDAQYGIHFDVGLPPIIRQLFSSYDSTSAPFQYLVLRGGVRYFESINEETPTREWRGIIEATPRAEIFGRFYLVWRNRLELRWVNADFSWRYRTRLWLERSIYATDWLTITPYLSSELFFDSRKSVANRTRTMAGTRFGVLPWLAPEVNVGYQHDWYGDASVTYFLSGIVNFYF